MSYEDLEFESGIQPDVRKAFRRTRDLTIKLGIWPDVRETFRKARRPRRPRETVVGYSRLS
jgi:hypothetical protein